jgi:adenylate cyclase
MAKEQERKFILKYLPTGGNVSKIQNILQGYLMLDDVNNLRVRINNDKAYMTYKQQVNNTTKKEFEYEIPLADGLELYDMAPHKLEKIRYSTEFNGNHVDMDVYPDGRMVVEIEYENELTELPEYCGEEVTGNPEWSNIQIAINNGKIL